MYLYPRAPSVSQSVKKPPSGTYIAFSSIRKKTLINPSAGVPLFITSQLGAIKDIHLLLCYHYYLRLTKGMLIQYSSIDKCELCREKNLPRSIRRSKETTKIIGVVQNIDNM